MLSGGEQSKDGRGGVLAGPTIGRRGSHLIGPRVQIPLLVVLFTVWALVGLTYFIPGNAVARRDWPAIGIGAVCLVMGVVGVWRALRLGVVVDRTGIRVRGLDSRDRFTPWDQVHSVTCEVIDIRAGLPLYGPVIHHGEDGADGLAIRGLGSYSSAGAQRMVDRLAGYLDSSTHSG